jgi:TRAP-type C4-dicarboxylate transport system permease large subunit
MLRTGKLINDYDGQVWPLHARSCGRHHGCPATIGPVIPPSIPMVSCARCVEPQSASRFLSGIIPGLLMGVVLMNRECSRIRKRFRQR